MKANPMTNTDTTPPPIVMIRRSWMVVTFCEDEDGVYGPDEEEFDNHDEALAFAIGQADMFEIGVTYGHIA